MAGISRAERERRANEAGNQSFTDPVGTHDPVSPLDQPPTVAADEQPPTFSVAERRLKYGDAEMLQKQADFELVGLTDEMSTYWGTTESAYDLINVYGWVPVNVKHLPMKAEMLGLAVSPEGYVTRGTKGSEMLFMMPKKIRDSVLFKQSELRMRRRLSARGLKQIQQQSAQDDANNQALSPAQRENARRHAASLDNDKSARWVPLPSHESHGREPE